MKRLARGAIKRIFGTIPLGVYRAVMRRDVVGLFYHMVSDEDLAHVKHLYPPVPVGEFEAALVYLKSHFNLVSYEELHAHRLEGARLPRRAAHLSFDDGYAECYTVVRPLLRKHGIPCTFFVTTDWIDNHQLFFRNKVSLCIEKVNGMGVEEAEGLFGRLNAGLNLSIGSAGGFREWMRARLRTEEAVIDRVCEMLGIDVPKFLRERQPFLTTKQIREMAEEGFTIGSHTCSHYKLAQLSEEAQEAEIVESAKIIGEMTGSAFVPFSFPNSASGLDRQHLAEVRQRHPNLGLFFDTKGVRRDVDFIVNRIWGEKPGVGERGVEEVLREAYVGRLIG